MQGNWDRTRIQTTGQGFIKETGLGRQSKIKGGQGGNPKSGNRRRGSKQAGNRFQVQIRREAHGSFNYLQVGGQSGDGEDRLLLLFRS